MRIGVSGAKGSFSEQAALYYCQQEKIQNCKIEYLISVENVLLALDQKKIDLGIFPIENSNGGIVEEAVYAMAKHIFKISKFFEIDIQHNLLVLPETKRDGIKKIASHSQALKQCRMYLKKHWSETELIERSDTATSAKELLQGKLSPDTAVIANQICADLYNLKILERRIQDLKFNFTTFLAVKKH